jgi:hypothetical protein
VNFDFVSRDNFEFSQKRLNFESLIPLKLYHFAQVFILHEGAVACELLKYTKDDDGGKFSMKRTSDAAEEGNQAA